MCNSVWNQRRLIFATISIAIGTMFGESSALGDEFRSINGADNNQTSPAFGEAETELLRLTANAYADGISEPTGGSTVSSLPSARAISNGISAQSTSVPNSVNASDWIWQWGQFLDHDIDLTGGAAVAEPFNIAVPAGDPSFDPTNTGTATISLNRSISTTGATGAREQINEITAFIDASNVYGSDNAHAVGLRDLTSRGLLRTSAGNMLPFNTTGLANDNGPGLVASEAFVAGDVRANEQIGLTSTHALFLREHNRLATELAARLDANDALLVAKRDAAISVVGNGVNNEADFLYQSARKVVGAQIQKITYEEFLPILLGSSSPTASSAIYDPSVDAGISNEFSTAAFRVGHTLLSSDLQLVDPASGANIGSVSLQNSFFVPSFFQTNSIENVIAGLASQDAQEVDTMVIDDVRNFLFGPPGAGGFDLASLNIQRGRDHGLSDINSTRAALGLSTYNDFIDLTGGDQGLANAFEAIFGLGGINDVDLWVGGLAEAHVNGGFVGETFNAILADQFERSRDGDRFFYEFELDHLLSLDGDFESTLLSDIILRNTDIASIQSNVFLTAVAVPEPTSLGVVAVVSLGCFVRRRRKTV
ncbi:PEP-CTERM sorting domain-containing protein [Mariniblastus sp.]|nr:PEP-CTERM sorting domain-containing protein [Mariniblastus sp.]